MTNGFHVKKGVLVKFNARQCYSNFNDLHVPEGITEIGREAFRQCADEDDDFCGVYGLVKVTLPTTCTVIGSGAFYSCQHLREVKCLAKLESLGIGSFSDCNKLESCVEIPENQDFIPDHLYDRCGMSCVRLPDHVKTIGYSSFYDIVNLTNLDLNKVEVIGSEAFFHCNLAQGLILPETVKEVCSKAFEWANPPFLEIKNINTKIADDAFSDVCTVTTIYVPKGFEVPQNLWGMSNTEDVKIIER